MPASVADVVVAIVAVLESEKTDSLKRVDIGARLLLEAVLKCGIHTSRFPREKTRRAKSPESPLWLFYLWVFRVVCIPSFHA